MELNKIFAALLLAGLVAMTSGLLAGYAVYPKYYEETAFFIDVPDTSATAAEEPEELPEDILPLMASADPAAGESAFRACGACHSVESGGAHKVGPNLWGVVGAVKAAKDGFGYSDALASRGAEGTAWSYGELNMFLANPRGWTPGTSMSYAGMRKIEDRANMIAYLRSLSDSPIPLPE